MPCWGGQFPIFSLCIKDMTNYDVIHCKGLDGLLDGEFMSGAPESLHQ